MITDTVLQASKRDERGKNAARRLRAAGRLPVSLYGEGQEAIPVSINTRELGAILRSEAGRGAIFTLAVEGGESTPVKIHTLDLDPVSNRPLHMDLVRLSMTSKTHVHVPVEFTGTAHGVKVEGGMFEAHLHEVEVECLPRDIPQSIVYDVTELKAGEHVFVRDLQAGDGVRVVTPGDHLVAAVNPAKGGDEPADADSTAGTPA